MSPENLARVYKASDNYERKVGLNYYRAQRERIARMASAYSVPVNHACGAFAALSPNLSEGMNYVSLRRCLEINADGVDRSVSAFGRNKKKALRILAGEDPLYVLSGNKVTAFYMNTAHPEETRDVTIDGHMINILVGTRSRLTAVRRVSDKDYVVCAGIVGEVADMVGLWPSQLQSIAWMTWRRINKILYNPQLELDF